MAFRDKIKTIVKGYFIRNNVTIISVYNTIKSRVRVNTTYANFTGTQLYGGHLKYIIPALKQLGIKQLVINLDDFEFEDFK